MTWPIPFDEVCSVCGEKVTTERYAAYTTFYTDLDGMPHGTGINPQFTLLGQCPKCGFSASKLDEKIPNVKEILESVEYKEIINSTYNSNVKKFICRSMIETWLGKKKEAGWCLLYATWALSRNEGNSYRVKTCEMIQGFLDDIDEEDRWRNAVVVADVYRQASEFLKAKSICNEWINKVDEKAQAFFQQELELIASQDVGRHRPKDALKEFQKKG